MGFTAVASVMTRPCPPIANDPSHCWCQAFTTPSTAEYWHIGDIQSRFLNSTPRNVIGLKRSDIEETLLNPPEVTLRSMSKKKVLAAILGALVVCVPRAEAAAPKPAAQTYNGGSFAWPTSPGVGYMGLYIDDDISHTRLVSTLRNSTGKLCKSLDDAICGGSTVSVYAILPPCGSTIQIDCIESIGSKAKSGTTETATFSRLFPEAGLADFAGDASAKIPTGSSPSIWTLPNTPHNAGNEYMAIVSVSGQSTSSRQSLTSPTIHASLYPVKVVTGNFARNVPSPDSSGVSHPSGEPWANCATVAEGSCAARQDFPADTAFSLSLRLSTPPTGWLHGRIFDPDISFSTSAGVTTLRVQANPAQVPAVATWTKVDRLPAALVTGGCTLTSMCGQSNPQSSGAESAVESWRPFYEDKASWVRGHWMYMTLTSSMVTPPSGPPGNASSTNCLADTSVLHGFVTTNATGYAAGPPNYSQSDKSFSYTVASPHYNERGQEIVGTYNFVMRSATARCLYGIGEGKLSATVAISQSDGKDRTADVAVADDGTWLKVSVSGFHYSSPVIKTTLTAGEGVVAPTTSIAPSTTSTTVVPSTTTTTTLRVPSRQPTVTTKQPASAVAVARYAGMKVVSGARVALKVRPGSVAVCRVRGTAIIGLKPGACRLTVSVTPRGGKTSSRSVNLVVPS